MKRILLCKFFCLFLCSSFLLQAQDTYVKINGVTTYKQKILDERGFNAYYRCRVEQIDTVTYLPKDMDGYRNRFGKEFLSAQNTDGQGVFLEYITKGTISLLFMIDSSYNKIYFLENNEGAVFELSEFAESDLYYKRILAMSWAACDANQDLINTTDFTQVSMKRTVKAHNNCGFTYIPTQRIVIGAGGGLSSAIFSIGENFESQIAEGGFRNIPLDPSFSYMLEARLIKPISKSNTALLLGLQLHRMSFSGSGVYSRQSFGDRSYNLDLPVFDINFPVGLEHTFSL